MPKKYTLLLSQSKVFVPVFVLLGMGLVALLSLTVLKQSQDVRERAFFDPYATVIAISPTGLSAVPTVVKSTENFPSGTCIPGSTSCLGTIQYTCTNSAGAYSSFACSNGCVNGKCAPATSLRPLPTSIAVGGPSGSCIPGSTSCSASILYTCTNSAGTYSSYRCPNGCSGNSCSPSPQSTIDPKLTQISDFARTNPPSGSCIPGSEVCRGDILYVCINSAGTYSSSYSSRCATAPTSTPKNNVAQVQKAVQATPTLISTGVTPTSLPSRSSVVTSQQTLQLSGVCAAQKGIKSIAGCLNTSDMKYWCNDGGYDVETCSTGAGTCRNSKCDGVDPLSGNLPTATPKLLPTQVIAGNVLPTPKASQLEGVCEANSGIKSVAGCINTSTMKYWCTDANTYDTEKCSTGAGTCRGNTCGGQDPLVGVLPPQPTPTTSLRFSSPTPIPSAKPTAAISSSTNNVSKLIVDAQGVCSSNGGINAVAGCLDSSRMKYWCKDGGSDVGPCSTGTGSCNNKSCGGEDPLKIQVPVPVLGDVRSSQVLQTQFIDLQSNGCGLVTLYNICQQAGKNCDLEKIVADSGFQGHGMHMTPLVDTLNNTVGLETEWLFSKQNNQGELVADTLFQSVNNLAPENEAVMKKTIEQGNVLFALVVVVNRDRDGTEHRTEHYVMIDGVDEKGNFTGVDPFFGQDRLVNKTGQVETINFSQWGRDLVIENVAVVQMPDQI
ncbi:MAG: hypothetical protein ABI425_05695 [Patescibacteria group bacterium]